MSEVGRLWIQQLANGEVWRFNDAPDDDEIRLWDAEPDPKRFFLVEFSRSTRVVTAIFSMKEGLAVLSAPWSAAPCQLLLIGSRLPEDEYKPALKDLSYVFPRPLLFTSSLFSFVNHPPPG